MPKSKRSLRSGRIPRPPSRCRPTRPPTGFEDARARLKHSRERIAEDGRYTPRYTDAQLEQLAYEPVTDSILVRVMEARYVDRGGPLQGTLGAPLAGTTGIKYWTTTFAPPGGQRSRPAADHQEDGARLRAGRPIRGMPDRPGKGRSLHGQPDLR